ncbi:hypothetical protein [Polaromonas sp.]|uniref:hypothetical protein n=1 Tax=Polaromonas sp. TaxID=1869339 RepID=UPI003267181C
MSTRANTVSAQAREHDRVFHKTFDAARRARALRVKVRPHRAITSLHVTPYLATQAIILPILLCGLLLWAKPLLLEFWRNCILFWSARLDLPFSLASRANEAGQFPLLMGVVSEGSPMPGPTTMVVTALVTLAAFALSLRMKDAQLPLKYPIRIVCVLQFVALGYFWFSSTEFPYSIARHSEELMTIGYGVMVATPVMLAMGYYILNQSLVIKLLHTVLILAFFAILIPHQVLVQAFIMQHLSVLFMPVLYICFGAVFDALIFVALYSWAVSNAPLDATN